MRLNIELDDQGSPAIRQYRDNQVSASRRELVNRLTAEVLRKTAESNPVASGRSREGWSAAAGQLSGQTALPNSENGEGSLAVHNDRTTTLNVATNHVPYIIYLEYGTSKMPPFAMLRRALASTINLIRSSSQ